MPFAQATRRKFNNIGSKSKGTSNPLVWDIPKTGLLAGIYLNISGDITGTLSNQNVYGISSVIKRIRLITNGGIDLINISGPQYGYLLGNFNERYFSVLSGSNWTDPVTAQSITLNAYLPTVLNSRDPLGLFLLQNQQTLVQLEIEFEADANVATGATVAATVTPAVEYFTLPLNREDWPALNVVQQILGDSRSIAATGEYDYHWPRGNTYVYVNHGFNLLAANPVDDWSTARVLINQSDELVSYTPGLLDLEYVKGHGLLREKGVIPIDLAGTAGLGLFGSSRDMLFSARVTELLTRFNFTGTGTLHTVRRQLVTLGEPAR